MARLQGLLGPLLSCAAITAVLASAPVAHELGAEGIDPASLELGLRARVGDALDQWTIHVEHVEHAEPAETQRYHVTLHGLNGASTDERTVVLAGTTDEDRSRELASTLALIIEAAEAASDQPRASEAHATGAPTTNSPAPARAFMVAEGHVGLGPPRDLDPELGVGLGAGAWLRNDHLQPRARVRWAHGWSGEASTRLTVHQLSVGVGLAAGAPIGRLWLGGLAMPAIKWTHAEQVRASSGWAGGGELSALAQLRFDHVVLGVRTGVETTFPALRASGTQDVIRWGHLRWLLVVEIGVVFPTNSELHR